MRLNRKYACSTVDAARLLYGNMQRPARAWNMDKDMDMAMDIAIPDPCYLLMGFECTPIGGTVRTRQGLIPHLQIMGQKQKTHSRVLVGI